MMIFVQVVNKIFSSKGRVIITGIGKSANIAEKIVSTFNSTGTVSFYACSRSNPWRFRYGAKR
jgi:D-arabinose 5-phosphate isomerase GutQ